MRVALAQHGFLVRFFDHRDRPAHPWLAAMTDFTSSRKALENSQVATGTAQIHSTKAMFSRGGLV